MTIHEHEQAGRKCRECGADMPVTPQTAMPKSEAIHYFATVWHSLANNGLGESVFGSLTFDDAESIANMLLSYHYPRIAGAVIREWALNDPEVFEERNEDGSIEAWLLLLPEEERGDLL